ncbi:unnamed protein product [Clonostachys chloroleuca]|uniref:SRR1-like domain-containing protein n=1 Tax=Clonostachys chloroleuca TaxID=1926264 RepID=A0AA35MFM2_9HYPO|nr:unnamed protein product [Clonostachys chloroleuca]
MLTYTYAEAEWDDVVHDDESVQAEADRLNNPKMDKSTQELVQWIKDLFASGAKLWTKEMLSDIEAKLAQNPLPETISIRSMNGKRIGQLVPSPPPIKTSGGDEIPSIAVRFKLYQSIIERAEQSMLESNRDHYSRFTQEEIQTLATRGVRICFSTFGKSTAEYSKVQQSWVQARQNWLNSSLCKELSEIIGSTVDKSRAVTRIVCFGLGSLARSIEDPIRMADDGLPIHGPGTQHAAALTLSTILGERLGREPLPVMVQDPAYSEADKKILEEVGIEVIGGFGSLGFTHVDEETIVFSCHPNIPVRQIVADIAKPAAMIWNKGRYSEEKAEYKVITRQGKEGLSAPYYTDHDSPRTAKLLQDYDEFELPNCYSRFGDLAIYVRKG